jgi:polysaccharide export outer membrane protein
MCTAEAEAATHDRFTSAHFLNHPQVSVVVDQYATQEVTLIGKVKTPDAYPIATPRPILDILALGCGLDDVADRNVLVERHGNQTNPIRNNLSNDREQAIKEQVLVDPGDTIVVSKAGIVCVIGDGNRPGGYTMTNNESNKTLLEALANAGGTARNC